MPKATKKSVCGCTPLSPEDPETLESQEDSVGSDQEQDEEVSFHPSLAYPAHPVSQVTPSMYMLYIECPMMDWTVNDGHYHRFLNWRLKCENILEYELAALLEKQLCTKVIAWNGGFGIVQYVSWNLPKDELSLNTI